MATRKQYDEQVKAAVMAALLAGQSVSSVAREYKLPKGTVSSWKRQAHREVDNASTQKKDEIGDLLLDYLTASLRTLKAQVEVFGDKTWLTKQPASELAVLHGVITDKAVRLLEGLAESGTDGSAP